MTEEKKNENFWEANQVIYSSFPISLSSFNLAYKVERLKFSKGHNSGITAQVVFEVSCLQDLIAFFFQRGINQERGITLRRKKYWSTIFSWGIHTWNFDNLAWPVQKLCNAQKSVTYGWMNGQVVQSNMPYQLLWSWEHNQKQGVDGLTDTHAVKHNTVSQLYDSV